MQVAAGGLSAKLSQFSTAWNVAFTTGSFATIACPSWMVGYIKSEAGAMTGYWNIASIPGGGGDWGGSYLGIPKASKHQKEAYDLISWLTAAEQQAADVQGGRQLPVELEGGGSDPTVACGDRHVLQRWHRPGQAGGCADRKDLRRLCGQAPAGGARCARRRREERHLHRDHPRRDRCQTPDASWRQLSTKDIPAAVGS